MATEVTANAGLTEEEVAALAEMDEQIAGASEDDPVFNVDDVVNKPQTAEDAGLLDKAKAKAEPEPVVEAAPEAAPAAEAAPVVEPAAEALPYQPMLVAQAPEGATERLNAIADEKKALSAQFDDGDLTASEMNAALDALNKEERTLERQIDRAEIARDLENQRITNERTLEITSFLRDVQIPNDPNNLRFKTLNAAVIEVASDPANATLGATAIMQKAHDLCVQEGVLPPKSGKPAPKAAVPKAIEVPPTLAGLPAADVSTTEENRFAHLNRMGPDAREAAFARMSEADQTAYLSAGA